MEDVRGNETSVKREGRRRNDDEVESSGCEETHKRFQNDSRWEIGILECVQNGSEVSTPFTLIAAERFLD